MSNTESFAWYEKSLIYNMIWESVRATDGSIICRQLACRLPLMEVVYPIHPSPPSSLTILPLCGHIWSVFYHCEKKKYIYIYAVETWYVKLFFDGLAPVEIISFFFNIFLSGEIWFEKMIKVKGLCIRLCSLRRWQQMGVYCRSPCSGKLFL